MDRRDHLRHLVLLVGITVVTRLPAILFPHAIDDESIYAVVGNAIVDGGRPYLDAIERKPPLLFWTYAASIRVAGEYNWVALHIVSTLWVLATMAGLYVLARQLFDEDTGVIAALIYSIFQPWGFWKNLAFNGEVLMNLPIAWAWAIALGPSFTRRRFELFVSGALLGAAFLLKQPAAIAAVPLGFVVFFRGGGASCERSRGDRGSQVAILIAGFAIVLLAAVAVLARQGILREALFWTVVNHLTPVFFWNRAVEDTLAFIVACLPVLIAAALALRDPSLWIGRRVERDALVGWLLVSGVGAAAGGRFYPHYYIQLLPPLAVLAAPQLAMLWVGRAESHGMWSARSTQAWLALTAVVFLIVNAAGLWLQRDVSPAVVYVREHSRADDRIFVWGQAPNFYLEAHRKPASRYIATFPLTGYIFGPRLDVDTHDRIVPGSWDNLDDDLDRHPPAFIVDTQVGAAARYPIEAFPRLARRVAAQYRLVSQTDGARVYRHLPPAFANDE